MELTISSNAKRHIRTAIVYYEDKQEGLGSYFFEQLEQKIATIAQAPTLYPVLYDTVRTALIQKFSHQIFFTYEGDLVNILGVFHTSQNPKDWPLGA